MRAPQRTASSPALSLPRQGRAKKAGDLSQCHPGAPLYESQCRCAVKWNGGCPAALSALEIHPQSLCRCFFFFFLVSTRNVIESLHSIVYPVFRPSNISSGSRCQQNCAELFSYHMPFPPSFFSFFLQVWLLPILNVPVVILRWSSLIFKCPLLPFPFASAIAGLDGVLETSALRVLTFCLSLGTVGVICKRGALMRLQAGTLSWREEVKACWLAVSSRKSAALLTAQSVFQFVITSAHRSHWKTPDITVTSTPLLQWDRESFVFLQGVMRLHLIFAFCMNVCGWVYFFFPLAFCPLALLKIVWQRWRGRRQLLEQCCMLLLSVGAISYCLLTSSFLLCVCLCMCVCW